jgi:hypothetical protein
LVRPESKLAAAENTKARTGIGNELAMFYFFLEEIRLH